MEKYIHQLADQAGTMTGGLAIILDALAAAEHKLTDLRASLLLGRDASDAMLAVTDDLAQLADYVADLKTRTAPASPPTPDGETSRAQRRAEQADQLAHELAAQMGPQWAAGMYGR